MGYVIGAEAVALVLLTLLVAGLLRSHAEILRLLDELGSAPGEPRAAAPAARGEIFADGLPELRDARLEAPAPEITGVSLYEEPMKISLTAGRQSSLVAFLSSGCLTCEGFWNAFSTDARPTIPGDARLVVVTKDSTHESPSRLRALAPSDIPVVMSTDAWEAYDVEVAPYFVFVDGESGMIIGEGAASAWQQVLALLNDALGDRAVVSNKRRRVLSSHTEREVRVNSDLAEAGIGPDHPSLYEG
jgi:hypothetical protein